MNYIKNKTGLFFGVFLWILASLFYALDYFQHTAPSTLLEPMADSLNVSTEYIGAIMSIYFPIYALSQIPAGYLLDRFSLKYVLSSSCLVMSLAMGVMIITSNPYLLMLSRAIVASGSALVFLGALKVANEWLPEKFFPVAVGLTTTIGVLLGAIAGQPLLNYINNRYNWQLAITWILLAGVLLSFIILIFMKNKTAINNKKNKESTKFPYKILYNKKIWIVGIYAGIIVGALINAFSELYANAFLHYAENFSSQDDSYIVLAVFIGIATGAPFHGFFVRFVKNIRDYMLVANIALVAVFAGIIFLPKDSYILIWSLFFLLGFFACSMLLSFTVVRNIFSVSHRTFAIGFLNMIIGIFGASFQVLMGYIIGNINNNGEANIKQAMIVLLGFATIGIFFAWFVNDKKSINID